MTSLGHQCLTCRHADRTRMPAAFHVWIEGVLHTDCGYPNDACMFNGGYPGQPVEAFFLTPVFNPGSGRLRATLAHRLAQCRQ
jgi:hypothetical protein